MIRTGTLQFHDGNSISVTFLTEYKLFTRSTRLLDSVDNSQDRSSAAGVISTQTQSRRIATIVLTIITILLFPSNPSTLPQSTGPCTRSRSILTNKSYCSPQHSEFCSSPQSRILGGVKFCVIGSQNKTRDVLIAGSPHLLGSPNIRATV